MDYVDLLINGQVIGLGRVEFIETTTHYGGERLNVGYVMVLIIDVIEPHGCEECFSSWGNIYAKALISWSFTWL